MDPTYDGQPEQIDMDAVLDGLDAWDDPAIDTYLERSQHREQERIETELSQVEVQLAARRALHDDVIAELEWHVNKYERERDRLSTPFAPKTETRKLITDRLRELRQAIREERRQHWQDRQQLARERRKLLRERAALLDDDLSELL